MSVVDLIRDNIGHDVDPTGRLAPTLNIKKIINDPYLNRPIIEAMSSRIKEITTDSVIYAGVGKMGIEVAKLLAFHDNRQFISARHEVGMGDDIISEKHEIKSGRLTGKYVHAELHSNKLRYAISRAYPDGPPNGEVSVIPIDDKIMFGDTMISIVKLLRSEKLRTAIGANIRIEGFAFVAARPEGITNLINTCEIREDHIKTLVRYRSVGLGQPLEVDFDGRKARAYFPDLSSPIFGGGGESFRPGKQHHQSRFRSPTA